MEHEVKREPKMYTCDMCGKPTPNYREWSCPFAAFLGERWRTTGGVFSVASD